jgi:hypothetical protein
VLKEEHAVSINFHLLLCRWNEGLSLSAAKPLWIFTGVKNMVTSIRITDRQNSHSPSPKMPFVFNSISSEPAAKPASEKPQREPDADIFASDFFGKAFENFFNDFDKFDKMEQGFAELMPTPQQVWSTNFKPGHVSDENLQDLGMSTESIQKLKHELGKDHLYYADRKPDGSVLIVTQNDKLYAGEPNHLKSVNVKVTRQDAKSAEDSRTYQTDDGFRVAIYQQHKPKDSFRVVMNMPGQQAAVSKSQNPLADQLMEEDAAQMKLLEQHWNRLWNQLQTNGRQTFQAISEFINQASDLQKPSTSTSASNNPLP